MIDYYYSVFRRENHLWDWQMQNYFKYNNLKKKTFTSDERSNWTCCFYPPRMQKVWMLGSDDGFGTETWLGLHWAKWRSSNIQDKYLRNLIRTILKICILTLSMAVCFCIDQVIELCSLLTRYSLLRREASIIWGASICFDYGTRR